METIGELKKALLADRYVKDVSINLHEEDVTLSIAVRVRWFLRFRMLFSENLISDVQYKLDRIVEPVRSVGMKIDIYIVV